MRNKFIIFLGLTGLTVAAIKIFGKPSAAANTPTANITVTTPTLNDAIKATGLPADLVQKALQGPINVDLSKPVASTYYLFNSPNGGFATLTPTEAALNASIWGLPVLHAFPPYGDGKAITSEEMSKIKSIMSGNIPAAT